MMLHDMTPRQRRDFHRRALTPHMRTLEERILANMDSARLPWQPPHMRRYYVQVARLQNRWLLHERRRLRDMTPPGEPVVLPPRMRFIPRPGYASKTPDHALTPLAVALSEPVDAAPVARPVVATPWPTGDVVQASLFGEVSQ